MFNRSHTKRDEEKFYQLFECSPLGISLTQLNGKLKVNKAFYKLLDYTEPELSNKHWKSITYKDDILVSEKITKQLLSGEKETAIFNKRYIKKSGDLIWVKLTSTLQKDKNGNAISFINIVSEINEQTINEIETSKNENISYNLFEYSQDALFIINKDTAQIVAVNQAAINLYGYSKDELLRMKSMDVSAQPEETKDALDKYLKRVSDRIHKRKDGSLFPVDVTASYYEQAGKSYSLVSVRDITQQKEFENRIKQNELRYKELFECNPQPMWLYDLSTLKFLMVNEMAVKKYGYSKEEFNRMTIMDIRPEEDIPFLMNHIKQMDKAYGLNSNWKHKLKDGSVIDVEISSHEIKHNGWKARVVQAMDITERRAAQIKLIKEHAKLNAIIECTNDIIFSVDKEYCYTSFNTNHAAKMKEIYLADIEIGQCILNYQTEEDQFKAKKNLDRALKGERVEEISTSGKKEVKQLYFQIVHNPIRDNFDEIIGVSVFVKDITESTKALQELKNKEEELRTLFNEDLTGDYISTLDGEIVLCNKKFREIYGFENEDEVFSFNANLLYKNPSDRIEMLKKISVQKKLENFELMMVRKD
jgi:PAS domain S-box-containing protein